MGSANLSIVNQIYVQEGIQLNSIYCDIAEKEFGSGIQPVDFYDSIERAQNINRFVEEKTMEQISNAVAPDSFGPSTSVVLLNVLYFKAK